MAGLAVVGGVAGLLHGGTDRWICGVIAAGGLYFLFLRPLEVRFWTRRQFVRRPDKNKEIEWLFAIDRIEVSSSSANSSFTWDELAKAVYCPEGLLLYQNEQIFHWIPAHAFQSPDELDRAAEMASAALKGFYTVL
jgi:hypothetical protein